MSGFIQQLFETLRMDVAEETSEVSKTFPITSIVQVLKVVAFVVLGTIGDGIEVPEFGIAMPELELRVRQAL